MNFEIDLYFGGLKKMFLKHSNDLVYIKFLTHVGDSVMHIVHANASTSSKNL